MLVHRRSVPPSLFLYLDSILSSAGTSVVFFWQNQQVICSKEYITIYLSL